MSVISNSPLKTENEAKRALLAERLRKAADDAMPLSFAQQRLWFLDQLEPNSPLYNVPIVVQMSGKLNIEALRRALDGVIARHDSLRTRLVDVEGNPAQVVDATSQPGIELHDLSGGTAIERHAKAQSLVRKEISRPFDLKTGPLIRSTLIRLQADEHWFVLNLHHVVSDEWSLKICFEELTELYTACCEGRTPDLPTLPIQYADYALWQRDSLKDQVLDEQLAYWREQLQGNPPVLELPADHARRPRLRSFRRIVLARTTAICAERAQSARAMARRGLRQCQNLRGTPLHPDLRRPYSETLETVVQHGDVQQSREAGGSSPQAQG